MVLGYAMRSVAHAHVLSSAWQFDSRYRTPASENNEERADIKKYRGEAAFESKENKS